jgi:hypothetical protein
VAQSQQEVNLVVQVMSCWNLGQLKSFVDVIFEIPAHLVVTKMVKKKGAKMVKKDPAASRRIEISPGKKPTWTKGPARVQGEGDHCRGQNFPGKNAPG